MTMDKTPFFRNGTPWNEDEIVLALAFYCNQPVAARDGHGRSEPLNRLAAALGRTSGSVALKLANLFACDPSMERLGKKGLVNRSGLDSKTWDRFQNRWDLLPEATLDAILRIIPPEEHDAIFDLLLPGDVAGTSVKLLPGLSTRKEYSRRFFRRTVLSVFGDRCCLTGINEKRLLVAAQIKPLMPGASAAALAQPTNGLCLNVFHARAFEQGLATVDAGDYRFRVSPKVCRDGDWFGRWFAPYEGQAIALPKGFQPNREYLRFHNDTVFIA